MVHHACAHPMHAPHPCTSTLRIDSTVTHIVAAYHSNCMQWLASAPPHLAARAQGQRLDVWAGRTHNNARRAVTTPSPMRAAHVCRGRAAAPSCGCRLHAVPEVAAVPVVVIMAACWWPRRFGSVGSAAAVERRQRRRAGYWIQPAVQSLPCGASHQAGGVGQPWRQQQRPSATGRG